MVTVRKRQTQYCSEAEERGKREAEVTTVESRGHRTEDHDLRNRDHRK